VQRRRAAVDFEITVTVPRRVTPGAYLVQRRVVHRQFYLRPSKEMNAIFLYCLAYAARCTGVQLHEFMVMSNHYHVVLSDPERQLPRFEQILNSFVARAGNRVLSLQGTFWERQSFSGPALLEDAALVVSCAYTLANPCTAGLVERPEEWTGVTSWSLEYGQALVVHRPAVFFSDRMDACIEIRLVRPPVMQHLDDAELREEIRRCARGKAADAADARRRVGRRVLGTRRVERQSVHEHPQSPGPRRVPHPRPKKRETWWLDGMGVPSREWVMQHRHARVAWDKGDRGVVFPSGTYLMRVRYGVACASP
jgi:putative transposase